MLDFVIFSKPCAQKLIITQFLTDLGQILDSKSHDQAYYIGYYVGYYIGYYVCYYCQNLDTWFDFTFVCNNNDNDNDNKSLTKKKATIQG